MRSPSMGRETRDCEAADGETTDCETADRGVSDLLAFTLTFSIIVTGIALVTVGGLGAFDLIHEGATTDIAETTMVGFAETTQEHSIGDAPKRSTRVKLQGHGLHQESSVLNVTVDGDSTDVGAGTLVRRTDTDTDIVYTSGAVFRVQREGLVVSREPQFRCSADSAHVSVLSLDGDTDVSTSGRITMVTSLRNKSLISPDPGQSAGASTVTVNVTDTAYPAAWQRLFDRHLSNWEQHPTEEYAYQCTGIDRAVVHNTTVELQVIT